MLTLSERKRLELRDWSRDRVDDDAPLVLVTFGEGTAAVERYTYTLTDLWADAAAGRLGNA